MLIVQEKFDVSALDVGIINVTMESVLHYMNRYRTSLYKVSIIDRLGHFTNSFMLSRSKDLSWIRFVKKIGFLYSVNKLTFNILHYFIIIADYMSHKTSHVGDEWCVQM